MAESPVYERGTPSPATGLHAVARVRALVIVNPAAGRRTAGATRPADVLPLLEAAGFALEVVETSPAGPTAGELASRAARERYEACVVAGGDGTVAPAARALLGTGTVLGILPFGSFMNIARGLGLPLDPREAARVIARRATRDVDAGEADGRVFFETAGIGLDAELFGAARSAERRSFGTALRRVRRWATAETHPLRVVVDGAEHVHRAMQVLVLNSAYYAWALPLLPGATMTDGALDVAVFPRMGRVALLRALYAVWRMRGGLGIVPVHYRGRVIRIESRVALAVHADGEPVGTLPVEIRCRAGALRVYAP